MGTSMNSISGDSIVVPRDERTEACSAVEAEETRFLEKRLAWMSSITFSREETREV